MITWIQNLLLKHNTWLFSMLLVVMLVTMVLFIGNQSFGRKTFEKQRQEFYGYDLSDPKDQATIGSHAELSLMMDQALMFSPGFRRSVGGFQDYAIVRVAAIGLANQIGIPNPTDAQLRDFLRSRSSFQNQETQTFDESAYTAFMDRFEANPQVDKTTIARVLQEDYRVQRLLEALAGPGYMLPFEAEKGSLMQETEWTVDVATTDFAAFSPEINPTEEDLRAYYEENPAEFTIPEQIHTRAVFFRAENFLSEVSAEPAEADLQTYFNTNKFRYRALPSPNTEGTPPEVTLADVRDQVINDYRRAEARTLAQQASEEFLTALYENEVAKDSDAFNEAVSTFHGAVSPIAPFSRENPPRTTGINVNTLQSAWIFAAAKNSTRYYSDLTETSDGAALVIVDKVEPARLQPYEEVSATVTEAVRAEEKRRLFAEQVAAWETEIDAALANGQTFTEAVQSLGFTVSTPAPFKVANLPSELNTRIWDTTQNLAQGEHSDLVIESDKAIVTFVENKVIPSAEEALAARTDYLERLITQRQETGGWFSLAEWTSINLQQLNPKEEPAN